MCTMSKKNTTSSKRSSSRHNNNNNENDPQQQQEPLSKPLLLQEMTSEERTSLLLRESPTAATTTSFADTSTDDDNDWEDILHGPPPSTTRSTLARLFYILTHTVPILLFDAVRLALFVVFLAPAFARFFYYYCFSSDRRVVSYKKDGGLRHVVDLYGVTSSSSSHTTSSTTTTKKPVLIFFTGGAWVIGYKMWGAFLAKVFAAMNVLVVIPDYPNYPFVTVPEMVDDAEAAIQWTLDTIEQYGGDPTRVILAGQSAGGHLASCVLLRKALQLIQNQQQPMQGFLPNELAGFCSISAPSDVQAMATNFQKHGLDTNFVQSLFGCHSERKTNMDDYDPQRLVEQLERELETNTTDMRTILPPMSIFHGTADQTVPYEVSEKYAASLQTIGVTTEYIAYEGWSHTDPILEAIMMADHRFHADLYDRLYQWTGSQSTSTATMQQQASSKRVIPLQLDDSIPECQPLCPTVLVQAARFCNPF